jgi:hypothetical protein
MVRDLLLAWDCSRHDWLDENFALLRGDWPPGVSRLAQASIDGDRVTISNVRNFEWHGTDQFIERWEVRTFFALLAKPAGSDRVLLGGSVYCAPNFLLLIQPSSNRFARVRSRAGPVVQGNDSILHRKDKEN